MMSKSQQLGFTPLPPAPPILTERFFILLKEQKPPSRLALGSRAGDSEGEVGVGISCRGLSLLPPKLGLTLAVKSVTSTLKYRDLPHICARTRQTGQRSNNYCFMLGQYTSYFNQKPKNKKKKEKRKVV